jgi:LDH2 family malate/lactate/ureidoglycolate dehydrogenase
MAAVVADIGRWGIESAQMAEEIAVLRGTRPADPANPVLIPGDPEDSERARRMAEGIPLPDALVAHVREVAAGCGAAFLLEEAG